MESLELDTLPPRTPSLSSPRLLKRPLLSSPHNHLNSFNTQPSHLPEFSLTRTSSPLTQSPSPSPKRRRITCPQAPSPFTGPLSRAASAHPLATLCFRDIKYVIGRVNHLKDTVVIPAMREEVVAWCADMVADLQLPEAIIAIAVNLFDRFIARQPVSKSMLYALSASCLLLGSKIILDDDVPLEDISCRARVPTTDIYMMETIILNVLEWSVNVVTPHEVVHELNAHLTRTEVTDHLLVIQDSLMLNALMDYRLANLRATSIGVACHILATNVAAGRPYNNYTTHSSHQLAVVCNISLTEVDFCMERLRASLSSLFGDIEELDSEEDRDSH